MVDGGTTLLDLDTPASATALVETYIGDRVFVLKTNIHATLTNVTSVDLYLWHNGKRDKQPPKTKKYFRSTKSGAGMTKAGVARYRRENPGSKLSTAVTEKSPTGKRASRRKSYCARSAGQMKKFP